MSISSIAKFFSLLFVTSFENLQVSRLRGSRFHFSTVPVQIAISKTRKHKDISIVWYFSSLSGIFPGKVSGEMLLFT